MLLAAITVRLDVAPILRDGPLVDHRIGKPCDDSRNFQAEIRGRPLVDDQFECRRPLERQIGGCRSDLQRLGLDAESGRDLGHRGDLRASRQAFA